MQVQRPISTAVILLLVSLFSVSVHAQIRPRPGDSRMFRISAVGGTKTHYPLFSIERSMGHWSVSGSIGGGFVGRDLQEVLFSDADYIMKHIEVSNSKTLTELPNSLGPDTYLWKTRTQYSGAMLRGGINYYFGRQKYGERLDGFYAGTELIYMRTFEYQAVTYREKNGDKTWTYDGMNSFNTFGMSLKAGYNWFIKGNPHYCVSAAISRPFYIPLTEEINLSSPFTAANWEFEFGFAYRLRVK